MCVLWMLHLTGVVGEKRDLCERETHLGGVELFSSVWKEWSCIYIEFSPHLSEPSLRGYQQEKKVLETCGLKNRAQIMVDQWGICCENRLQMTSVLEIEIASPLLKAL